MDKSLLILFGKYLSGNLASSDRETVSIWYNELSVADAGFNNSFVKKMVRDSLWADIQSRTSKSGGMVSGHYSVVAAAVLLIISTAVLCIYCKKGTPGNQTVHSIHTLQETGTKYTALMNSV